MIDTINTEYRIQVVFTTDLLPAQIVGVDVEGEGILLPLLGAAGPEDVPLDEGQALQGGSFKGCLGVAWCIVHSA